MLTYNVIILGTISSPDRTFKVKCEFVDYERDCIVFKTRSLVGKDITVMAVPQGTSIVKLIE